VPVEFLLGVLGISVVANGALLLWLARSDRVRFHWPVGGADSGRAGWPAQPGDARPTRRRALFVAGPSTDGVSTRTAIPVLAGSPTTSALPPDLAELLGNPAPLASRGDAGNPGSNRDNGNGSRPAAQEGLVRVGTAQQGRVGEAEMPADPLTALVGPQSWTQIIEVENARLLRYRRPSTIVVAEVDGLRKLSERMGEEPVARLLPVVGNALRNEARSSDWIARIGYGRFAAFLAETDEIAAINYVERIRQICEPWLSSAAVPLRLAIGWSSPSAASDLEFAIKRAEERMHSDRRLPAKLPAPRSVPARVVALPGGESTPNALPDRFASTTAPDDHGAVDQTEGPRVLP
jgi:diguanylate cyclase (GGDEF)-like protein